MLYLVEGELFGDGPIRYERKKDPASFDDINERLGEGEFLFCGS